MQRSRPVERHMTPPAPQIDAGPRELRAGPLRAWWSEGDLRCLRVGGVEVVRRVFAAVRDEAWGTVAGNLTDATIEQHAHGFTVAYGVLHHRGRIAFEWRGTIDARSERRGEALVTFEMAGAARSAFRTNRTGLCVLHPLRHLAGGDAESSTPTGRSKTLDSLNWSSPTSRLRTCVPWNIPSDQT